MEPRPGTRLLKRRVALKVLASELAGVAPSSRQGSGGLGAYAYEQLGWRTAAVVGEDDYVGWSLASGFVAEFCSLEGTIVKRVWVEPNAKSWAPAVGRIPSQPTASR